MTRRGPLPWSTLQAGAYEVQGLLGEGGMALVLGAVRVADGREFAVKVLKPDAGLSRNAQRRFESEVRIASEIVHPALVQVVNCFEEDGQLFLVMERMQGTVHEWVALHDGPVPPRLAAQTLAQVLEGLGLVHGAGVVHRDIKPENLLIDRQGNLKLSDFGVAQLRDESTIMTATGMVLGTIAFMAPEQKTDARGVGPAADIYAMGATLSWMLTRSLPFDLYVKDQRERAIAALHPVLGAVIERACQYQPQARYGSADEMAEALRSAAEKLPAVPDARGFAGFDPWRPPQGGMANTAAHTGMVGSNGAAMVTGPISVDSAWSTGRVAALVLAMVVGTGLAAVAGARWIIAQGEPAQASRDSPDPLAAIDIGSLTPCEEGVHTNRFERRMGPLETQGAAAADLDGDGRNDLVYINQLSETMSIYWGSDFVPLSAEGPSPEIVNIGRASGNPAVGDVNGDGHFDLLITRPDNAAGGLVLWLGTGERGFDAQVPMFQDGNARDASLVDWNGDGHLDLFLATTEGLVVRHGDGVGGFAVHRRLVSEPQLLRPVAFMGKAGPEVWYELPDGEGKTAMVRLLGDGRGGVAKRRVVLAPHAPAWGVGTVLGQPDVYVWGPWRGGPLARLTDTGDGGWKACQLGVLQQGNPKGVADLNGDGLVDLYGWTTCAGCASNHLVGLAIP